MSDQKEYLGDSVYAEFDGWHIVLTTRNGLPNDPSNEIALDPYVLTTLEKFRQRVIAEAKEETK